MTKPNKSIALTASDAVPARPRSPQKSTGGSKSMSAKQRALPTRPSRTTPRRRRRHPRQNKARTLARKARSPPEPSRATPLAPAIGKPDSGGAREALRVGARVLAAYWNEKREFEGFWLATVKRIEPDHYTLECFESPEYPPFKSRPQDIAVPHPEFRVTGK
jgi:hypothetical protein